MEKKKKSPQENLRQARFWAVLMDIAASALFLFVYIRLKDSLFLIASLLLLASAVVFFFVLKYMEKKYDKV